MYGMTFKGVHTSDLGVLWQSQERPILPAPKLFLESAPSMDGSFDLSTFNTDMRLHYEDRLHTGILSIIGSDLSTMQTKLSTVASWLQGDYSYLVFDDMPNTAWFARVENLSMAMYELQKVGIETVIFRSKPFSTKKEVLLSDDIMLGDIGDLEGDFYIGGDFIELIVPPSYYGTAEYNHTTADNHFYSKPAFVFRPNMFPDSIKVTLKASGRETKTFLLDFNFTEPTWVSDTIWVDFNSLTMLTSESGEITSTNGNFFELPPGDFDLIFEAGGSCVVEIYPNFQYLYEVPV